jgi:hypothetical protein
MILDCAPASPQLIKGTCNDKMYSLWIYDRLAFVVLLSLVAHNPELELESQ